MEINWDKWSGKILGVIFCLIVGKCFLLPDLSIIEILKVILESQIWWVW